MYTGRYPHGSRNTKVLWFGGLCAKSGAKPEIQLAIFPATFHITSWFFIYKYVHVEKTRLSNTYCISFYRSSWLYYAVVINPLNPELNPICYLLALLAHHFLHVSRISVKSLTLWLLMSYIYGAPILDVSRSHTTTQHSR